MNKYIVKRQGITAEVWEVFAKSKAMAEEICIKEGTLIKEKDLGHSTTSIEELIEGDTNATG